MSSIDTDRLTELIAAKLQVIELLLGLARRQLDLAERGEMAALLKLLAAKQTVLGQLQRLERELDPYRDQDPACRSWRNSTIRQHCQALADRCAQSLAELMTLEKEGEAAMLRRREAAAGALSVAQSAADARTAYSVPESTAVPTMFHCEG